VSDEDSSSGSTSVSESDIGFDFVSRRTGSGDGELGIAEEREEAGEKCDDKVGRVELSPTTALGTYRGRRDSGGRRDGPWRRGQELGFDEADEQDR